MDSLKEVIESILFVAGDSVEFSDIAEKLQISQKEVELAAKELQQDREQSFAGIQVQVFNNKAQLCSNPNYAKSVEEVLNPIKEKALTKAVLEVAAIIAYKQPMTRLEIEQVRGVNSDYAVNVLIENSLIEVLGRKDAIGKPLLYGTTDLFLKRFNLESLKDLPDYEELLNRIKIIHNPENTLFDFTNIPDSEKEPEELEKQALAEEELQKQKQQEEANILQTQPEADELQKLEEEIELETVDAFFDQVKNDATDLEYENKTEGTLETPQDKKPQAENKPIAQNQTNEEENINYSELVSILDEEDDDLEDDEYDEFV